MATVELSFTALPAHVRTARLVATAAARRSGVDEALLDEVRLAVGEACARAVEGHQRSCPAEPVRLALHEQPGRFQVEVTDTAGEGGGGADDAMPELGIALLRSLAEDVQISATEGGTVITMSWPASGPARPPSPARLRR